MNYILLSVSGPDGPGITYKLMNMIASFHGPILDIGQSVTYGILSLNVLIDPLTHLEKFSSGLEKLAKEIEKEGLRLNYKLIEKEEKKVDRQEKFIISCVCTENLTAKFIGDISKALADSGVNINRIDNPSPEDNSLLSLDILASLPVDLDRQKFKSQLFEISNSHRVDVALLKDNVFRKNKRLIVLDMDSTLIQTEVIDEMAKVHGVEDEITTITEKAMNGEIDFNDALVKRVKILKGFRVGQMHTILNGLSYTPGCEEFIHTVKSLGHKVALISGGFSFFADALKKKLDLDYAFSNDLEIVDGRLTGGIQGQIINADQKAFLLKFMAQQEKISLEQVVAIGDGANDLPMLSAAGLGIAYHAKGIVRERAQNHMSHGPMTSILCFLGIPKRG